MADSRGGLDKVQDEPIVLGEKKVLTKGGDWSKDTVGSLKHLSMVKARMILESK